MLGFCQEKIDLKHLLENLYEKYLSLDGNNDLSQTKMDEVDEAIKVSLAL